MRESDTANCGVKSVSVGQTAKSSFLLLSLVISSTDHGEADGERYTQISPFMVKLVQII